MRSGIVALGREVSGQPSQSDMSLISKGAQTWVLAFSSALSLAQMQTQATNTQTILIGSSTAINLLSGEHVDIAKDHTYPTCIAPFEL